jgi:hypothetical protein
LSDTSRGAGDTPRGRGGARKGAGRPPAQLPEEVLEMIGPEPIDPLDAARWYRRVIWHVQRGVAGGQPWKELLNYLLKSAKVTTDLCSAEIAAEVARKRLRPTSSKDDAAGVAPTARAKEAARVPAEGAG